MEIGNTIRSLRAEAGISQEELAERIFVSRQTISNWENGKFYPDVQSLALIAELFSVSIDSLVKGDLPMMESKIVQEDAKRLKRNVVFYGVLITVSIIVMTVSFLSENWLALGSGVVVYALAICFAFIVDNDKKRLEVRTYREIKALCDGVSIEEIKAQRENQQGGRGVMWKVFLGGVVGAVVAAAVVFVATLLG